MEKFFLGLIIIIGMLVLSMGLLPSILKWIFKFAFGTLGLLLFMFIFPFVFGLELFIRATPALLCLSLIAIPVGEELLPFLKFIAISLSLVALYFGLLKAIFSEEGITCVRYFREFIDKDN